MSAEAREAPSRGRWYAVQTTARHENRVCQLIQQEIEKEQQEVEGEQQETEAASRRGDRDGDRALLEVMVPTHEVVEIRKGKRVPAVRPLYPGYLLVRMVLDQKAEHRLSAIKGVRLVRQDGRPHPLREDEVNRIMGIEAEEEKPAREEIPFRAGQVVEIVQGPFADFSGSVQEVYSDKGKVKVEVSLFGRPTSVELDFTQLKGL